MVYLDYAANTPVDKAVLDLFYDTTIRYIGNPNSNHKLGKEAKKIIDSCTINIAKNLNVLPEEIIYTSGATESNNLAIKGIAERYKSFGKHIILSPFEHNSIMAPATYLQENGFDVEILPVNHNGLVDINALKTMLRDDTILVSVTSVDSELGLIQPIEEIAAVLKNYPNTYLHTDASQSIGKVNIDYSNVDLITIAPHKFYGLNGIGILVKKKDVGLRPIIHGGKSTTIFRSGTPVTSLIASADLTIELAINKLAERFTYVKSLNERIINHLKKYKCIHINNTDMSIPYTINFSIKGVKSLEIAKMLEDKDIYVSTKTSCCPLETPSKLVYALTKDKSLASTSVRVSLSHLTTNEEIDVFIKAVDDIIKELTENGKI